MVVLYIFLFSFLSVAFGMFALLPLLKWMGMVDKPNSRSNHQHYVMRGGGAIIVDVMLLVLFFVFYFILEAPYVLYVPFLLCIAVLALVSFVDDKKNLSILPRIAAQLICVLVGFYFMFSDYLFFAGLMPRWLDHAVIILLWLWFINLFNFMDGIDGISCTQILGIATPLMVMGVLGFMPAEYSLLGSMFVGVSLGFLLWNWHPAKVFLGDVGSITLGYVLGWLLLMLVAQGYWVLAVVLPMYYWIDSGLTLLSRIAKKECFWEAHSSHMYQKTVRAGMDPRYFIIELVAIQLLLFVLSYVYIHHIISAFTTVIFAALIVLLWLGNLRCRGGWDDASA